jgi:hypothetical protein
LEFKAFKEIRKFLSIRRFKKGQERMADVQFLAKVIRAWYERRPVIKESSERYKKSNSFRRYRLQMQAFIHFAIVVKSLKHYRLKLDYLKKLTYYNKRKAILTALSENV